MHFSSCTNAMQTLNKKTPSDVFLKNKRYFYGLPINEDIGVIKDVIIFIL